MKNSVLVDLEMKTLKRINKKKKGREKSKSKQ
jgi:hypothetical protein